MNKKSALIAIALAALLTFPAQNLLALDTENNPCTQLQNVEGKLASAEKRNKFLNVTNPRSNQAPVAIEQQRDELAEQCVQYRASLKNESESALAQPDLKASELNNEQQ
jgi:hypothetical protein